MVHVGSYIKRGKRVASVLAVALVAATLSALPTARVWADNVAEGTREKLFQNAAQEFNVPENLLKAISYNQSRWENHKGEPSVGGGYGLMHLVGPSAEKEDGRGDPSRPLPTRPVGTRPNLLGQAAKLASTDAETVKRDDRQNVRAGAALLASFGKDSNNGILPANLGDWYGAIVRVSGISDTTQSQDFADAVYGTLQRGTSLKTSDGQKLSIAADGKAQPNKARFAPTPMSADDAKKKSQNQQGTECPRTITCKFVPAYFGQNNPNDPLDYGNMDTANRPNDMKIKYIVIHDTEGSYQSAIDWFQNPASYVAVQYVIRSSDGEVTQTIKGKDVGWQAGNWYMNMHSIGIEHEGYAAEGGSWYTEAMYRSSAKLVRYLADKYDVPLDRQHIIGHDQVPGINPARVPRMHYDPGPYWDWDYYMDLLHGRDGSWQDFKQRSSQTGERSSHTANKKSNHWGNHQSSNVVTITPRFDTNQPPVTACDGSTCIELPRQGTNFVYLRTEPRDDAPLITDAALHPDGSPGTTKIQDWSAKAAQGQNFAIAERRNNWTAIWFSGQKAWFYNPDSWKDRNATPSWSRRVAPKVGKSSIPVYGRPIPEKEAYQNGVPPIELAPLQYTIKQGQAYPAYSKKAKNDYYYVSTFDRSNPGDGTIVVGNERYIPIEYNHRQAFVKASDVDISWF